MSTTSIEEASTPSPDAEPPPISQQRPSRPVARHSRSALLRPSNTPPLGSRRSVASMKSLMPLTLSPSSSSGWSTDFSEEPSGGRVDDYLPEVLARDLELSASIFASNRMTAGTPVSSSVYSDDRSTLRSFKMTNTTNSARSSYLGPIKETRSRSRVSFVQAREPSLRLDDTGSDEDTLDDAAALSIRQRGSLITVATSLASTNWKPSGRSRRPSDDVRGSSWIDGDSDDDEDQHLARTVPSRRPPTPPESDLGGRGELRRQWGYHNEPALRRKSHSVSGGSLRSCRRMDVPLRPASITGYGGDDEDCDDPAPPPCVARRHPSPESRPLRAPRVAARLSKLYRRPLPVGAMAEPSPVSEEFSELDDDGLYVDEATPLERSIVASSQPPPARPGLRSVQSWLNGSLSAYPLSLQTDDLTKVVPLPPDAMETLRVSIACFPETMLLSTSLTIETIRSYSRKVRQPSIDLHNLSPLPEGCTPTPRKSLWRKVVPYRRGFDSQETRRSSHHSGVISMDSTTSAPPKPWASLRFIFGPCSEYICDALYAHIVAYNYLSALVARNPPSPTKSQTRAGSRDSKQEDIPHKAASLLGLSEAGNVAAASLGRLTRKLGTPLGTRTKHESATAQSSPAGASLENMQHDLLRCIVRLVGTARSVAEKGTGEDPAVGPEPEMLDMVLVRSLCEIVRLSEEGY